MHWKFAICTEKKNSQYAEGLQDTWGKRRELKAVILERATSSPVVLMRGEKKEMADSFQYLAKPIQYCKVKKKRNKKYLMGN